ncbi:MULTISPECIES: beta/alpha barrel domain-containing protein [Burkholderia cepacia complex]|uniref:Quinolinate phosphoribosyl transferase N-terminal domain-containing protein n=1 Tax=Burkholderia multivorans TaxID=87883 RepID=A0A2S9M961_9BURK|nr:hypothetical protein [Burkholderia multivorans]MCW5185397.1 hypothetical protein [Burkholderia cenocepacia]MBU9516629.1 hypothetical protein [Burkholderia multivorans]MBU9540911.1 hypothetical protein [Burkholderia multivorans]MBU9639796.1 hypothetical protein [Burkholderia multivorans]
MLCRGPWFNETLVQVDPRLHVDWKVEEGESVTVGQTVCEIPGPAGSPLTAEWTALNLL